MQTPQKELHHLEYTNLMGDLSAPGGLKMRTSTNSINHKEEDESQVMSFKDHVRSRKLRSRGGDQLSKVRRKLERSCGKPANICVSNDKA